MLEQGSGHSVITMSDHRLADGLPPEITDHVENCPMCGASLEVRGKYTLSQLRAIWVAREPERKARELFRKDCNLWYDTWQGWVYIHFGGPFWSRRAKWLGQPRWENYKPKIDELSKETC